MRKIYEACYTARETQTMECDCTEKPAINTFRRQAHVCYTTERVNGDRPNRRPPPTYDPGINLMQTTALFRNAGSRNVTKDLPNYTPG